MRHKLTMTARNLLGMKIQTVNIVMFGTERQAQTTAREYRRGLWNTYGPFCIVTSNVESSEWEGT